MFKRYFFLSLTCVAVLLSIFIWTPPASAATVCCGDLPYNSMQDCMSPAGCPTGQSGGCREIKGSDCGVLTEQIQGRTKSIFGQGGFGVEGQTATPAARIGVTLSAMFLMIGILFLTIVIYSGIQWMTAGGNEEAIKKSKTRIIRATTGLAIVLGSWIITNFILGSLLAPTAGGGGGGLFIGGKKIF